MEFFAVIEKKRSRFYDKCSGRVRHSDFLNSDKRHCRSKKLYLRFCMIIFSLPSKDMFQLYGPFKKFFLRYVSTFFVLLKIHFSICTGKYCTRSNYRQDLSTDLESLTGAISDYTKFPMQIRNVIIKLMNLLHGYIKNLLYRK